MSRLHYIGADTHCSTTDLAAVTRKGRLTQRERCPTTIAHLRDTLAKLPSPRVVIIEEGPLADWLFRELSERGEEVIVCDPRRNALIARDSDKDDPIDAEKLARLAAGGYLKQVHHPETFERVVFKRRVGLYHDRFRNRVRQANRILAQFRMCGVFIKEADLVESERKTLLRRLPRPQIVRDDVLLLLQGYDSAVGQETQLRRGLIQLARRIEPVRRFIELPGIHWIRAATLYAYLDTPWRFKKKTKLFRYLGIGLERRGSGTGPRSVNVTRACNRLLKSMILGAATTAIAAKENPFAEQYRRCLHEGMTPRNARRTAARSLAAVLWGMWKSGAVYQPERVGVPAASQASV
jgi:transposase